MSGRCAILVFEGFQLLDMSGPLAVLEVADRLAGSDRQVEIIANAAGPIRSSSQASVLAEELGNPSAVDTLIVTGGGNRSKVAIDPAVLAFVSECARNARRTASVCTGAFILAAAGVLDGHVATTHWDNARELSDCFPAVRVEPDRIYVRSGSLWTSAGVTAGIDLALALVTEDYGEAIARATAQELGCAVAAARRTVAVLEHDRAAASRRTFCRAASWRSRQPCW